MLSRAPIIAAGGIGDGRGAAAATLLGASAVCLGTRFVIAKESLAHAGYKTKLCEATAEDTFYGEVFDVGWPNAPHRVLRNDVVEEFQSVGRVSGAPVSFAADGTPIPKYSSRLPLRGMTGGIEKMALYAGQSVGFS